MCVQLVARLGQKGEKRVVGVAKILKHSHYWQGKNSGQERRRRRRRTLRGVVGVVVMSNPSISMCKSDNLWYKMFWAYIVFVIHLLISRI